ncbi:hypothetical protein [Actinoplanes sp. NPDC051851]|uniref:hypothetical protein n=1 Tax=Actinoplanes sp. NPDC051851 TaxID=3154753 RepID=UPI00343C9EC8
MIALLIGGLVLAAAVYGYECWRWPLAHCLCCKGAGKHHRADGKVFRKCWWCEGSGSRRRAWRWAWDWLHRHG